MTDQTLQQIISEMIADHNESIKHLRETMARMEVMMHEVTSELKAQQERHDECKAKLASAFVDGDVELHRREHEAQVLRREASAKFWQDLGSAVAKWGIIGLLAWLALAVFHEASASIARFLLGVK